MESLISDQKKQKGLLSDATMEDEARVPRCVAHDLEVLAVASDSVQNRCPHEFDFIAPGLIRCLRCGIHPREAF